MNEDKSRVLLWAGAACLTMGWIAEITAAAFGPVPAWPNWLMLVAVTGLVASNLLRSTRPRVYLVVAMALLTVVAAIGMLGAHR